MRNLPIEAKIVVFKTIAISKLAYLALLSVIPKLLSKLNIKFVTQIFRSDGTIKNWNNLNTEFTLQSKDHFSWLRLVSAISEMWKNCLKQTSKNTSFLVVENYNLIKGLRNILVEKVNFRKLHSVLIIAIYHNNIYDIIHMYINK